MTLLSRLWDMSPRELTGAVFRRIGLTPRVVAAPDWHRVAAGPLAGAELYLAPEAVDTWRAMVAGTHDRFLFDAVELCRPFRGAVCWDVGAHFGYHTLAFAALVETGGRVIAFEPNPANLSRLAMNLARNPGLASRTEVKPIALSDMVGLAEFRFSDHVESGMSTGGHLASASAPNEPSSYGQFRPMRVETTTIDGLIGSGQVPAPDLMKIDVEGAEAAVLRGGREVIRARRPVLLLEVHHILQMIEVYPLLTEWGYRLEVLDREHASAGRCFSPGSAGSAVMNRVAIACSGLGAIRRGNEAWARTVAESLHEAGEPIQLYGGGPLPEARCPYTPIWNVRRDWRGWPRRMTWGCRYAYEQQTFAWLLARRLRRDRPDVVHTADPILAYRLSRSARRGGFSLVYKDGLLLGPDWCRRFDWVQILAPHYLDEAVKAGLRTDRWSVIPHFMGPVTPADPAAARHAVLGPSVPEDAFVVLAVGDFAPESNKRLDWVVSEVASLGPGSRVHLLLAGQASPDHVRRFEELCRPLGDRAHLRPNAPPDRMPELYRAADAFAHAALREPFGIVFIEALSSGLPAVGHPFPVTSWIIGPGGATADMTRPGELARVLDSWRREPHLRRDLGMAGRERAMATFTAGRIVPLYRQLYASVRAR